MGKRLSLIMNDADEAAVAPYVSAGTLENAALRAWAAERGDHVSMTEASMLRALLKAGVEQIREDVLVDAYDELAEDFEQEGSADDRRAARDRYSARSDRGRK